MIGAEFIAETLSSGTVFGLGVGARLRDVESAIHLDHVDDVQGRRGKRLMRRDYGLLEVTFGGEPDWECRWISVEVHRFSTSPDLIGEARELMGVEFSQYTAWSDVQCEFNRLADGALIQSPIVQHGYKVFRSRGLGLTVQVVDDRECIRGDFPGFGDVWSIEVALPADS
ncbi:hypothetical protein [Kitasatospora sp. NPDC087315]|uniref:hypothetical protein n=1 Tax=Kitasatospora sp. NPDC087315 TaxID=3364069 RepID=UPI00380BB494